MLRIGSLFSGYGGLDLAVTQATNATVAWHVEFDKHPSAILAHHFPDVPNYGDVTAVDWSAVEPVQILTGGFPCQDLSTAGKRAGLRPGTRSGLWEHMAYAIDQLRPELVVIENVRGLLSAAAHSDVEPCPLCVGDDPGDALRALGAVLGDLADLGYDARWLGLRAADAGAPHGRFRVFVVAYPAHDGLPRGWASRSGWAGLTDDGGEPMTLLPTPAVNDMGAGKTVEQWDAWTAKMKAAHGNGNGHGASLAIEAQRLLPTPVASDCADRNKSSKWDGNDLVSTSKDIATDFGPYAAAVARWETVLGRPAPNPTEPGTNGQPRLSPAFVEWMMGLPQGWVTDVGIPRNAQLKALGNGVVPQQAALALQLLGGAA